MKKGFFSPIVFISLGMLALAALKQGDEAGSQAAATTRSATPFKNTANSYVDMDFGKMPLYFIANRGQLDGRVAYYVQGKDKTLYFTREGMTIALNGPRKLGEELMRVDPENRALEVQSVKDGEAKRGVLQHSDLPATDAAERWVVKLGFVGANPDVKPMGTGKADAVISYFKGKPQDWKTGLPTYSKIVYPNLWPGIDLAYYGDVNRLKYEFIVHPGADPSRIRLSYQGASGVSVNEDGRLEVKTPLGSLSDDIPMAYQEVDGERLNVDLAYFVGREVSRGAVESRIAGQRRADEVKAEVGEESYSYGFRVGEYDRSLPLVLDPAILVYCGYIGGSAIEYGYGVAVDSSGNAYVTGKTWSTEASFPEVVGPDLTFNGGNDDAFVAKVKADGTGLVYCGYIGGSSYDRGYGIAVDSSGNAYVAGETFSTQFSFPVIVGPDLSFNGDRDAFVAKVNTDGTGLAYCGYIGGSNMDWGDGIAVDGSGNAYITGVTYSTEASFPEVVGPDLTYNGSYDAFVAKVEEDGTGLVYCGYIGGSDADNAYGIAVDGSGNAYITGQTLTTEASFPVTVGPDLTYNGGVYDAFVAKVKEDGTGLVYCGYIGGSLLDRGYGIAVDSSGAAYVTGRTFSTEASFPVTVGPDLTFNGVADVFVAKVDAGGTGLVYCGYIGGLSNDLGLGIAVDGSGAAYVTGDACSTEASFPLIIGPDLTYNGGDVDAFVAKVKADGTGLIYCGYVGSPGRDWSNGIAVDGSGNAYIAGMTGSTGAGFPVIVGPDLTYNGGDVDAFVAKVAAFSRDDLLGTWSAQGVRYRNSDTGAWVELGSPATMITAGDLDGDGIDDLIGIWPTQVGVWVKYSKTGAWSKLCSTADWIGVGDMNGDGRCDFLGTWAGQGVYYRNSVGGAWVKMAAPAAKFTAGDLDGDRKDDLIGIWPAQDGVWVKYSNTGAWSKLSAIADWISSGDINADGRVDFLGTWAGQGVYYRNSIGGAWVKMASPATQIVAGQIDSDLSDDLLGMWASQEGVWVKYSKTGSWSKLGSTADWISAAKMRALGTLGGIFELTAPGGGFAFGPSYQEQFEDLSESGPLGIAFQPIEERNTAVGMMLDKAKQRERQPGPGEPGFVFVEEKNLIPQEGLDREQPKQTRSRATRKNSR